MSKKAHFYSINININWATNISTYVLHLFWVLKYHLYFNLSSWSKAYLIDDQSRGNNKQLQSGYVYVHEKAEKIVEGIVDKFCLFFSSIRQSCKSATWQRHS